MPLTIRRRLVDRVRQLRKIAYAVCVALVVLAIAVVFLSISSPNSTLEVSAEPTFFNASTASRLAEEMTVLYKQRSLGSEDAAGVVPWMQEKLLNSMSPPNSQAPAEA